MWSLPDVIRGRAGAASAAGSGSGRLGWRAPVAVAVLGRADGRGDGRGIRGDRTMGLPPGRFDGWGVVAASRYLGRANLAQALRSFLAEGVWGTSPHLIPHFALHSPAGTISLALGLHGPNLGVGGGLYAAAEGFLAALTWVSTGRVPGVWLVLTGWSPELVPNQHGNGSVAGECQALAMALAAGGMVAGRSVFRAVVGAQPHHASAPIDLVRLADRLERRGSPSPGRSRPTRGGGFVSSWIEGSNGPG